MYPASSRGRMPGPMVLHDAAAQQGWLHGARLPGEDA